MRLLLTGASGFIGSAFLAAYRDAYEIETFSFQKDLNALTIHNIDTLVHLSALVHQMEGAAAEAYHEVNVVKTVALAQRAKASGVKQFVFMSSVKVYGEENSTAYREESPCHPQDPYGESKLAAEKALLALADETFKVAIIRTPVVYGEGVKANILRLIELTDRFTVLPFGKIKNRRSMVYVGNLAHLISEVIMQQKQGIFLAADDVPISTSGLIELIAEALGKKTLLFTFLPLKLMLKSLKPQLFRRLYGDLYIDNVQTQAALNLSNPYTLQEGITRMVTWYKAQKQ